MRIRKILFVFALAAAFAGCKKDDWEHGYADKEALEAMLQGRWLTDLDGDSDNDVALMQLNFKDEGCVEQTLCLATGQGENHLYNLVSANATWTIVENYDGYSSAGLKGDAIKLSAEDEDVYYLVDSISPDFLKLVFAYGDATSTFSFDRVYEDIDTLKIGPPKIDKGDSTGDLDGDNESEYASWMSKIPDDRKICDMCIPGSHDSGTYGVENLLRFAASCQSMDLRAQWDHGCRAFDLRVRTDGKTTNLYHNFVPCHLTLKRALSQIQSRLKENPTETAIVIIKPESNDAGLNWFVSGVLSIFLRRVVEVSFDDVDEPVTEMYTLLDLCASGSNFILPRPDLTMGEARGKIIVIFRFNYKNSLFNEIVGYASKWGGNGLIYSHIGMEEHSMDFYVQDEFGQNENEEEADWADRKKNAFTSTWDASAKDSTDRWYFNAASGYHADAFSIPNYPRTARRLYRDFISYISYNPGRGIVLQDYTGIDNVVRVDAVKIMEITLESLPAALSILTSIREVAYSLYCSASKNPCYLYDVSGDELTRAIISLNFRD